MPTMFKGKCIGNLDDKYDRQRIRKVFQYCFKNKNTY